MTNAIGTTTTCGEADGAAGAKLGAWYWLAYLVPLVLLAGLTLTYAMAPRFYVSYVLNPEAGEAAEHFQMPQREAGFVEILTVLAAIIGGVCMLWAAWRVWRRGDTSVISNANSKQAPGPEREFRPGWVRLLERRGSVLIIASAGLAALFFAGEEISWGQTIFHWNTPATIKAATPETNLHNVDFLPIHSLANVYLACMYFGVPIAWCLRRRVPLFGHWRVAVPEGPVWFTMIVAAGWRFVKVVYLKLDPAGEDTGAPLYTQYIEQINEHREMIIAVALLVYGLFRLSKTRLS